MVAKDERDIQREIYQFIEDEYLETGKPLKLQVILDKFCPKYHVSEPTITRQLDALVAKRGPFRLVTWYEKPHRYYCIRTISKKTQVVMVLSVVLPIVFLISDAMDILPVGLFEWSVMFVAGFWIGVLVYRKKNGDR